MRTHVFWTILLLASIEPDAVERVRLMVPVLARVEDDRFAVTRLARLGRAVCRYDGETAAFVFRTGAARQSQAQLGGSLTAWQELLASAGGCDPVLAASLAASAAVRPPDLAQLAREIHWAMDRVKDEPQDAASRIEPAVAVFPDLSRGAQEDFVTFLLRLRKEDEERADEMFHETVRFLGLQPARAVVPLFVLGNYLYADSEDKQDFLSPVEVHELPLYDLRVVRREGSPDAAWFYLRTLGDCLQDNLESFALAVQLYPRAREYSNALAEPFHRRIDRLAGVEGAAEVSARFPPVVENLRPGLRKWQRELQVSDLAAFAEARDALLSGQRDLAFALSRQVRPGLKLALLFLGVAAAAEKAGDRLQGTQVLTLAAREFEHTRVRDQPWLWMAAAGLQPQHEAALFALGQAVKAWNELDASHGREAAGDIRGSAFGFVERVMGRQFPLNVPGVTGYAFADIAPVFAFDLDRLEAEVAAFKNQERRLDGQIEVLALRLRGLRRGD